MQSEIHLQQFADRNIIFRVSHIFVSIHVGVSDNGIHFVRDFFGIYEFHRSYIGAKRVIRVVCSKFYIVIGVGHVIEIHFHRPVVNSRIVGHGQFTAGSFWWCHGFVCHYVFRSQPQFRAITRERCRCIHKQFVAQHPVPAQGGNQVSPSPVQFRIIFFFPLAAIRTSCSHFGVNGVVTHISA